MVNVVVFTCIFGDYDELNDPLIVDESIEYVCFTDNPKIKSNIWDVRIIKPCIQNDSHKSSKFVKICGHKFLQGFDYSLYIDGNMILKTAPDIPSILNGKAIAVEIHPSRNCIYDEVSACDRLKKDSLFVMNKQIKEYQSLGFPAHAGLFECGVLARDWRNQEMINLCEIWWQHVLVYSKRDQLSFPFVFKDFPVHGFSRALRDKLVKVKEHAL